MPKNVKFISTYYKRIKKYSGIRLGPNEEVTKKGNVHYLSNHFFKVFWTNLNHLQMVLS